MEKESIRLTGKVELKVIKKEDLTKEELKQLKKVNKDEFK
jgi:hypothetical protein